MEHSHSRTNVEKTQLFNTNVNSSLRAVTSKLSAATADRVGRSTHTHTHTHKKKWQNKWKKKHIREYMKRKKKKKKKKRDFFGFLYFGGGVINIRRREREREAPSIESRKSEARYDISSSSLTRVVQPCKTFQWLLLLLVHFSVAGLRCAWKVPPLFCFCSFDVANSAQFETSKF